MGQLKTDPAPVPPPDKSGRRVYRLIRSQLADGTLALGAQVPSTRSVAAELGVSRTTVTAAYEQLAAEGFIATSVGRVARVMAVPAVPADPPVSARRRAPARPLSAYARRVSRFAAPQATTSPPIDFRYGPLAGTDFPLQAWRKACQAALATPATRLEYIEPEGDLGLRTALQGYLRRARGIACSADRIVVVHGSQQAIDLCARLLLDPGDAYVFEEPGYLMARCCFDATGARAVPVPVDAHGIDTDQLPDDPAVRLAYVTPSHQFPLGGVLPVGRRQQLLQWARRRRAWIVEDDYDGEFRYGQRPIDALQVLDGDHCVIYVGTVSKALSPQLRLGYLVLPPALVPVFRHAKRQTDRHAPVLDQRVLATLIDNGGYERHVRRMRREHEARRAALLMAIAAHLPAGCEVAGAAAGLHVVLWLHALHNRDERRLVEAALAQGVGVYPVSPLYARAANARRRPAGLVVGYASLSTAQIARGVEILGDVIRRTFPRVVPPYARP